MPIGSSVRHAAAALLLFGVASGLTARTEIAAAAQPQLAVAADGQVWLVYGHGSEIFVARSTDDGATFTPAVRAVTAPKLMLGMRRGPRIAATGARVTVTYVTDELRAVHSKDGGRIWSDPVVVNDVPGCAREGLHDLALGPDGRCFVTWLDHRNAGMELWFAESTDSGATWSRNAQIYQSSDRTICECCHPTALFDAAGNLAVMWRNAIAGDRDMWIATRPAGASKFSPARKSGEGSWQLAACPMDGGRLIALGNGDFAGIWQRAGTVFYAPPRGPEKPLGPGKQPVALVQADGARIVWQQGTDLVTAKLPSAAQPTKVAPEARFPVLAALPANRGAVLAYEQGATKDPHLVIERLP